MYNIIQVANAVLSKQEMTPKKLQKICYYIYSWYLAVFEAQLFEDKFEAWVHGPVSPTLYQKFKSYGWNTIRLNEYNNCLSQDVDEFVDRILEVYGAYSANELETFTHEELPWQNARAGLLPLENSDNAISREEIIDFYSQNKEMITRLSNLAPTVTGETGSK